MTGFSRRNFLHLAGAGALAGTAGRGLFAQQQYPPAVPAPTIYPYTKRATVSLVQGEQRRKNVCDALVAIDDQIRPLLKVKKRVVIKINNVEPKIPVACTHVDALMGIMDYLAPRFKGPVVIAEASARDSLEGFENNHYSRVAAEFKSQQVSLVDLNREGKYEVFSIVDANIRPIPVRLAARLLDPDAFVVCSTMLKTHNAVVATLSVKNMVIGTPLHSAPGDTPAWHDKQKYHAGPHQMNYNMAITAARLRPHWGVAVIDGYEGMEGNGPSTGTPVPSRIALASTDFFAADRVGLETMGIPAYAVGYLLYASQLGLGQYDLAKIDVLGVKPEAVKRTYRLHDQVDQQLNWLRELPRA
jgi:uncharacterized protein (DUF362 family)